MQLFQANRYNCCIYAIFILFIFMKSNKSVNSNASHFFGNESVIVVTLIEEKLPSLSPLEAADVPC